MGKNSKKIEYLRSYKHYWYRQQNYIDEHNKILAEEAQPCGIDYSADRVQTSPEDGMLNKILRIEARTKECDEQIEICSKQMAMILDSIMAVNDGELQRLLYLRYIKFWGWEQIAEMMQYSLDHTKGRLHGSALGEVTANKRVRIIKVSV